MWEGREEQCRMLALTVWNCWRLFIVTLTATAVASQWHEIFFAKAGSSVMLNWCCRYSSQEWQADDFKQTKWDNEVCVGLELDCCPESKPKIFCHGLHDAGRFSMTLFKSVTGQGRGRVDFSVDFSLSD